jgi:5-methylcytosine-specific restriction endonuclease McrA
MIRWPPQAKDWNAREADDRLAPAIAKGTHTPREWRVLCTVIEVCVACRMPFALTRDHIVPVSEGGCDCIANLQPACARCNSNGIGVDLRAKARPNWLAAYLTVLASREAAE